MIWMYRVPVIDFAFRTLSYKSAGYDGHAVAMYGTPWASMMPIMSFDRCCLPKTGVVAVRAPIGVAPDR